MKADNLTIMHDTLGNVVLTMRLTEAITTDKLDKLAKHCADGKFIDVDIDKYHKKRSSDSNSYMWQLLQKMADVLGTSKDELYLEVLGRYGVFTHVIVKANALEGFKGEYRLVRELGDITVNGVDGIQLQCYFGSSGYNQKQMSTLLNGVVSECKELEIETETPQEIARLIALIGE